jgi:hypothetical protein
MRRDADGMFRKHERQPLLDESNIKGFVKTLIGWRKTIF